LALEYAIRKAQKKQVILKLNGKHQIFAYAYSVNELGDSICTIKKNIDPTKKVGLDVNADKLRYISQFHRQNARKLEDIKPENKFFQNVSQFKYSGTTLTNEYLIQDKINRRLNSGNACHN
jgi:hypothetical protein